MSLKSLTPISSLLLGTVALALTAPAAVRNVSFNSPQSFPSTANATIAVGDFNGDGIPDLVVAGFNTGYDSYSVLLGNGDGTFQPQLNYPLNADARSLAVADFNHDGKLDLAEADYNGNVLILLGKGDGTFEAPAVYPVPCSATFVAAADFDGDGKLDLAVTQYGCSTGGSVLIMLGNGHGAFQPAVAYSVCKSPVALAVGDFDGDGSPDVAAACQNANGGVSVLLNSGDGTFDPEVHYPTGAQGVTLVTADFNGDGALDLAVAGSLNSTSGALSILLGNGNGTFQLPMDYPVGDAGPSGLVVGDFGGHGADLAVSTANGSGTVLLMLGNGDGHFQSPAQLVGNFSSTSIPAQPIMAVADLNHDGALDIVGITGHGSVSVLLGNAKGTFSQPVSFPSGKGTSNLAAADLNGDGIPDLAVTDRSAGKVSILLGNGKGAFRVPMSYPAGAEPGFIAVGDVNGDGQPDLVIANTEQTTISVLLGNGDGTFKPPLSTTVQSNPVSIALGDFNGDGKLDLAVASQTFGVRTISILLGNGNGTFQPQVTYGVAGVPNFVAVGDFNGDGKLDLAVSTVVDCHPSCGVSILLGKGDGTFGAPLTYPFTASAFIAVADFNGDGKLDLAVVAENVFILTGYGDGTFQTLSAYSDGFGYGDLAVADFNGDGIPDIAVATNTVVSLLLGTGNGAFTLQDSAFLGGASPAVADFNGDGKPDLAVTDGSLSRIAILTNTTK